MNCPQCLKETGERYMIDSDGMKYCSDHCLDQYFEEHEQDLAFEAHPYEDTYRILRRTYYHLLDHWEEKLNKAAASLDDDVEDQIEEIDELVDRYADFVHSEGDDGPYAWEIYQFTLKLHALRERISAWVPSNKTLYWVSNGDLNDGTMDSEQQAIYNKIWMQLFSTGYDDFILYVVKHHQHPAHWGVNYVFSKLKMAEEAYEILKPVCEKYDVPLFILESHRCEGYCGNVLESGHLLPFNGSFYCPSCLV